MEFSQIAILFVVAAIFGSIAKVLKQPIIIGYLFAGIVLAAMGLMTDVEVFSGMGQIGVTLLLFLVGLEINLKDVPTVGKTALVTGLGQILFTSSIGYILAKVLGFGTMESVYIAIALTFSSTIIIVKLLSEKNDLSSLYGKISVGFLLVQDIVAVLILVFLAGLGRGETSVFDFLFIVAKAIILFVIVWFASKRFIPKLFERAYGHSQELLLIISIAWAFGVAAFVAGPIGFSLEIGGFLAGLSLSNLPEHFQISSRMRPLRDFFLTIFFILLGSRLVVGDFTSVIIPALIFSVFVLLGNPVVVMTIMGALGFRKRTSFSAGLTVAQISEFSFIIVAMGATIGHIENSIVSTIIVVGVITMTASTYVILDSDKFYKRLKNYLNVFEKKNTKEAALIEQRTQSDHAVIVGGGKSGKVIYNYLKAQKIPVLIIDFDPRIYTTLTTKKIPVLFGDIADSDILDLANIDKARVVVSTLDTLGDNLLLAEYIKNQKRQPPMVATALGRHDAISLYEKGVDFVVVPQETAGEYIRHVFKVYGVGSERITKMGKSHFNRLVYSSLSSGV